MTSIKELRERAFPTFTEEEREEAGRILREYLALCARIYETSNFKKLIDGDSTSSDSGV